MTETRFVTLTVPLSPGVAAAVGVPEEGLKTEMPFSKGGCRQPPLPINFACNDAAFANFLYRRLEPYIRKNAQKASSNGFIEEFTSSKEFKEVAREADKVSRLFWSVKYGKGVGVYFQSLEALHSIDTATSHFRQGFAFRTFTEAVRFQMGTQKNPANRVYNTADAEPESEPSSPSAPTLPTPQTPRRPHPASADSHVPHSPQVFIQVNTQGTPMATQLAPFREQYWGRRILMGLGFSDAGARRLGQRAIATHCEDFLRHCAERYAERVNAVLATALWDMYNNNIRNSSSL
ncbi:hypothetical protein C8R42DRAFT_717064 [Lentinula raphanica]|nr:hypothetical protein C8R42DRAFT_717064 [Lentinula raphanica]